MTNTDKYMCRALASLLSRWAGVRDVILSPGSRVAPLTIAMDAVPELQCHTVIDERCAAFEAVGMSAVTQRPVALCCTSGTALLNYAPAVAEAYYRQLPLLVISADRPAHVIDQNDSQTMRQPGALANIVKTTVDIDADTTDPVRRHAHLRDIVNAIDIAATAPFGPVHINVRIDEPLNGIIECTTPEALNLPVITRPGREMPTRQVRDLGCELASPRKVMIVCGFSQPDDRMSRAIGRLCRLPNVVVLAEQTANIHASGTYTNIDAAVARMCNNDTLVPDVVISCGGALVSRTLKEFVRNSPHIEVWRVGTDANIIDTFNHLDRYIVMDAPLFMQQLASAMQPHRSYSSYAAEMAAEMSRVASIICEKTSDLRPWSQLTAMAHIFRCLPKSANLQLSNGMTVRYASLLKTCCHRIDCNRGVSGIDGSVSTAVGAAKVYDSGLTVLLTGDMSARYDIAALLDARLPSCFRTIIFDNNGGNIFRIIKATRDLPVCEEFLAVGTSVTADILRGNSKLRVYEADDRLSLDRAIASLFDDDRSPAVAIVHTNPEVDKSVYSAILKSINF